MFWIKVFVASVKTFPSAQTINATQLKSLFGLSVINPGDAFEIGLDVRMADRKWYPAFNSAGIAYWSGPMNLIGASPIISFKAPTAVDTFVASYTCDEPAEAYSYGVSFTKINLTTIKTANY